MANLRPSFQAVIFDFDGTLADSFAAITASVNHVRAQYGLKPLGVDGVKPFVGRGPEFLLARTVPGGDPTLDGRRYRAHYAIVMGALTRLEPGADRLTAQIRAHGIPQAVCSNKPVAFTRTLLSTLGIRDRFDVVLGPEDVARPKPAPDMLICALEKLSVESSRALYVGDTTVDVNAGQAAGVETWAVAAGSASRSALTMAASARVFGGLDEIAAVLFALVA